MIWTIRTISQEASTQILSRKKRTFVPLMKQAKFCETHWEILFSTEKRIYGLLQLNDRHEGKFSEHDIVFYEWVASLIGILFNAIRAKKLLEEKSQDVLGLASARFRILEKISDKLLEENKKNNSLDKDSPVLKKLEDLLENI